MKMKQDKKALGRGLSALISNTSNANQRKPAMTASTSYRDNDSVIQMLLVREVFPNPNQPRKNFSAEELHELADSINEHGVVNPIIVRAKGQGYEIIFKGLIPGCLFLLINQPDVQRNG